MRPNIPVRVYKPRQVTFAKEKPGGTVRRFECRPCHRYRHLALMVATALALGVGLTQVLHGKIVALRAEVDQLQSHNTAMVDQNHRLVSDGVQIAAKTQVVALAKRKLKLFEPDQGQVRRM